jgi:hypothetical protein
VALGVLLVIAVILLATLVETKMHHRSADQDILIRKAQ